MDYVFSKSVIGYSHVKNDKWCQDFSSSYKDSSRTIITCADGHGGEVYVRSHIGSSLASKAVNTVFSNVSLIDLYRSSKEEIENKIKLNVLCEWNRLVESHLGQRRIRRYEISHLNEDQIYALRDNPSRAFGTTLTGAMVLGSKLIVVGIGDTEVIGFRKGSMSRLLEEDDEPAGNFTHSMCQEDAYKHLKVKILDWKDYDGVILCTDGLSSPYQSYDNFNKSFIKPLVNRLLTTKSLDYIDNFVETLALQLGIGDDVSLSFIIKENSYMKYYK